MRQRMQRWLDLWDDEGQPPSVTPSLERLSDRLDSLRPASTPRPGAGAGAVCGSALVPLCGKSADLVWLADRGLEVVGVDNSRRTIAKFAGEQGFELVQGDNDASSSMSTWHVGPLTIVEGDWFDATPEVLGGTFDFAYDHAALTAVDPARRTEYVARLVGLIGPTAWVAVVAAEFDEASVDASALALGPHSLSEQEVRELFPDFDLELVEEAEAPDSQLVYRRLREAGASGAITLRTFLLQRQPPVPWTCQEEEDPAAAGGPIGFGDLSK